MAKMGKKSKRQAASAAVHKPQSGTVINNRAVCRAVNELWESKTLKVILMHARGSS